MKKLSMYVLVSIYAMQMAAVFALTPEKTAPKFTLTLSEWRQGGLPPSYHRLSVIVTNISSEVFLEPGCSDMRDLYHISVFYNGVSLEEKDVEARHRREAEQAQFCTHELGINKIKPGESFQRLLELSAIYEMSNPGTYEVTVSRETDPAHPDRSATVKSNTITIVVPEPETTAPQ